MSAVVVKVFSVIIAPFNLHLRTHITKIKGNLLGCEALLSSRQEPTFQKNLLPQIGVAGSSETLVPIYQITWCDTSLDNCDHDTIFTTMKPHL